MTRKIKLFSFLLSLILVMVSVPMSVNSVEITDIQNDLSVTQSGDELVEQSSFEEITDIENNLDVIVPDNELVDQELTNEIASTTSESNSQLVTGIPDGIYAIEIATFSSYYISYSASATYASCSSIAISPMLMGMPAYLFKITRVPDTDRYIIRSMVDQTKTLKAYPGYVTWTTIPIDDSQVPEDNTFNIIGNNGALLIKEVGTDIYICGGSGSALVGTDSLETQYLNSWIFRGYRSYIEDGVYSFKNVGNSGMWASTQNDSYEAGANIQQKEYDYCPIDSFSRGGMFKINRISNTDQYTIRLMTNNLLAWSFDGTSIVTENLPQNEADIPNNMRFHIAYDSGNYMIIPYSTFAAVGVTQITNSSEIGDDFDYNLNVASIGNIPNYVRWYLYKYTGQPLHNVEIIGDEYMESKGVIVGETYNFNVVCWSTSLNIQDCFIALSSQYMNIANLTWNDLDNSATFMLNTLTDVSLCVGLNTISNGLSHIYIMDDIQYMAILPEQTIYLQNSYSQKYANVKGPSMENGTIVHQRIFSPEARFQWEIEHISGCPGYIRFKSLYSNKYLGVNTDNPLQICQYDSLNDNTIWKILPLDNGSYKIICKATESSGMVLSVSSNSSDDGAWLSQRSYTVDTNDSDEWNLVTKVISYVNYYDSSLVNNTTIKQLIPKANEFCNLIYAREFGIAMYTDGTLSQYPTIADDCTQGINSPCSHDVCGDDCSEMHHKNIYSISNQLFNEYREDDHIYILWANRIPNTYCIFETNKCKHVNYLAVVCNKRPIIQFLRVMGNSNANYISCMGLILAHETAHTFGMSDVYDDEGHDQDNASICVMERFDSKTAGAFFEDIKSGEAEPFCDSCTEKMLSLISNINITGNQGGN